MTATFTGVGMLILLSSLSSYPPARRADPAGRRHRRAAPIPRAATDPVPTDGAPERRTAGCDPTHCYPE
ncbi:hypothetical protein GCM10023223_26380 [Stackebrandtia albiflava]